MGNIINFNQKMEENKMASEDTEKMVEEISTAFWSFYEEKASKIEEFLQKNKISIEFVPLGKITPIWDNEYEYTLYSVIMKNDTTNIVSFNYYDDSNLNINNEGDELILLCNIFENFSIGKYKDFSEKEKTEEISNENINLENEESELSMRLKYMDSFLFTKKQLEE